MQESQLVQFHEWMHSTEFLPEASKDVTEKVTSLLQNINPLLDETIETLGCADGVNSNSEFEVVGYQFRVPMAILEELSQGGSAFARDIEKLACLFSIMSYEQATALNIYVSRVSPQVIITEKYPDAPISKPRLAINITADPNEIVKMWMDLRPNYIRQTLTSKAGFLTSQKASEYSQILMFQPVRTATLVADLANIFVREDLIKDHQIPFQRVAMSDGFPMPIF